MRTDAVIGEEPTLPNCRVGAHFELVCEGIGGKGEEKKRVVRRCREYKELGGLAVEVGCVWR